MPHLPFISDSNLNKFAIDTSQYPNTTKDLLGFAKGKRTLVTYYRLLNREGTNNRTNVADLPTARNIIDAEYQKILNLEITLPKGFEFTTNNQQANQLIQGSATFYPNMNPNIGDMFLIGTGDGRQGLARISSVTPLSWRQDRLFVVNFVIPEFVDPGVHFAIDDAVTLVSVFSKQNYLSGTAALLSEQTYLDLEQIKAMRSNLCRFYHGQFFDRNSVTYIHPDGFYDPWAVMFMANKLSFDDLPIRPKNLLGNQSTLYNQTLWSRLDDRYNPTLYGISPKYYLQSYFQTRMGSFVTELNDRLIVYPSVDATADYYLYSENFYNGTQSQMSAEELLIYKAITLRDVGDLSILINQYLTPVYTLSAENQFYKIPVYIHLIDMALQSKYREIDAPSMNYASSADG